MPASLRRAAAAAALSPLALMLAAPAGASASTIRACVQRHSGATRIVSAHARCRRGEQLLTWNTAGPAGARGDKGSSGTNGTNGSPGASGAAAGFSAAGAMVGLVGTPVLVSKMIPPGSFIVRANAALYSKTSSEAFAGAECTLTDTPGTEPSPASTNLDPTGWAGPLGKGSVGTWVALASVSFDAAVSSNVASTLGVYCQEVAGAPITALSSSITAVQTSSNG